MIYLYDDIETFDVKTALAAVSEQRGHYAKCSSLRNKGGTTRLSIFPVLSLF